MHFSLRSWEKRVVPDIVQKNGVLWWKRWLERVPKIIGRSSEVISNALKWKAKPESRGWKKTKDFPLERIEGEPRVAKTVPMIGSRVIKDRLKIPLSAVTTRFAREHVNRPKENWRTILCTDESNIVPFFGGGGSKGAAGSLSEHHKTLYWSLSEAWRRCKHHDMGILFLSRWAYVSHTRDHGSVCPCQKTSRDHVVSCRRGNAFQMGVPARRRPQKKKKNSERAASSFQTNEIKVMERASTRCLDLNPTEHLWTDIEKCCCWGEKQEMQRNRGMLWDQPQAEIPVGPEVPDVSGLHATQMWSTSQKPRLHN